MKRRLLKISLLLLAGAAMTIAVAWCCVVAAIYSQPRPAVNSTPNETAKTWDRLALLDWNASPTHGDRFSFFGYEFIGVNGGSWESPNPAHRGVALSRYLIHEVCAGWPLLAFCYVYRLDNENPPWVRDGSIRIPIRINRAPYLSLPVQPLWPGFAINTILYTAILWVVFCGPGMVKREIRRRRGLCPECAYPVGSSSVCTECGAAVPGAAKQAVNEPRPSGSC